MESRGKKRTYLVGILIAFIVFILAYNVIAASVCRTISPTVVTPSGTVTVTLDIDPDVNTEVMAVDEIYPSGFTVASNPDGLFTDQPGHLKYLEYSNPQDDIVTYTLTAPSTTGTYDFTGIWMVDNIPDSQPIECDDQVQVQSSPAPVICSNIASMDPCNAEATCTWCTMYGTSGGCVDTASYECDTLSCNVGGEYCHNCRWQSCSSGYVCDLGSCILSTTPTPTPTATSSVGPTPTPTSTCTPSWSCTAWSECDGTYETRTCTDSNSCGILDGKPAERQRCGRGPTDTPDPFASPTTGRTRIPKTTPTVSSTSSGRDPDDPTTEDSGRRPKASPAITGDEDSGGTTDSAGGSSSDAIEYLFYILIIVLVLLCGGFLFYYVSTKNSKGKKPPEQNNLFANPPSGGQSPGGPPTGNAGYGGGAPPAGPPTGKF